MPKAVVFSGGKFELSGVNLLKRITLTVAYLCLCLITAVANGAGDKPASLSLKDAQGNKVKLGDLRGKIVVVNFWATWCGPCNAEMPMVVKTAASYADKNVVFIGANADLDETAKRVPAYVQSHQIAYPIWMGASDSDLSHLQLGIALPATIFVDTDGVIRARILGQMRPGEIEERVDWLLSDRQKPAPPALVKHLEDK